MPRPLKKGCVSDNWGIQVKHTSLSSQTLSDDYLDKMAEDAHSQGVHAVIICDKPPTGVGQQNGLLQRIEAFNDDLPNNRSPISYIQREWVAPAAP